MLQRFTKETLGSFPFEKRLRTTWTAARLAAKLSSSSSMCRAMRPDDTRVPPRKDHDVDRPMGSGAGMTNFCVTSHPTLLNASRKPYPRNRRSRAWTSSWSSLSHSSRSNACLNFHHFGNSQRWICERVMATTNVYPQFFEITITLTFRAGDL